MSRTERILPAALTTALHLALVFWIGATLGQGLPPRDAAAAEVMQVALIEVMRPTRAAQPSAPVSASPPPPAAQPHARPLRPLTHAPAARKEVAPFVKTASAMPRPATKPERATPVPVATIPRQTSQHTVPPAGVPAPADRQAVEPVILASADAVQIALAAPPAEVPVQPPRIDASSRHNPKPRYPQLSRRLGEEGQVLLDLLVRADGSVGEISVRRSSGSLRLDQAALDAVRHWRYLPAHRGGEAIAFRYVQPVEFALND